MITPKQIEASHSGSDTRQPRKTPRDKAPAGKRKPVRERRNKATSDPLFNALRGELGL